MAARQPAPATPAELVCSAVTPAATGEPPSQARATDRQRVGVALQAAALLSHLDHGGWHLPAGWRDARVTQGGLLAVPEVRPGRSPQPVQELLCELLAELFAGETVAGRGQARRATRALLERWRDPLAPLPPDRAVADVLEEATFLWERPFGPARSALAAEHRNDGASHLWVAGPGPFRAHLLAAGRSLAELGELLAGEGARALWAGDGPAASPATPGGKLERAAALLARGRFEAALGELAGLGSATAEALRLRCQVELGALGPARATLRRLEAAELPPALALQVAEAAARALANRGEAARAAAWVERAFAAAAGGPLQPRAELLAADAAWDRGDLAAMARHLEAARAAPGEPDLAWRWERASGHLALRRGEAGEAVASFSRAVATARRRLSRHEAAGLWNDLGLGRAQAGDLAGAERAFRHASRLLAGCDGARRTTLALYNLAEIRLRRGQPRGVAEILERSTAENRLAGNRRGLAQDAELWARYELVLGRPAAALAVCREALSELDSHGLAWRRAELATLAARALGWLGRPAEAAAELAAVAGEAPGAELEPEERPALWAHAGLPGEARQAAAGTPWADLWTGALAGEERPAPAWDALARLEPYRAARLAFDLDLACPGTVPAPWRRVAAATLRRVGAAALAERLEARDLGSWQALADYLARPAGDPEGLARLFLQAGYPEVALPADGAAGDPVLRALAALAARDQAPPRREAAVPGSGLVGESPALRAALERAERLARGDFAVLVQGESGTGKELIARLLHRASGRSRGPFVAVNCAALPEGLLLSDLFGHVRGAFTGADRDRAGVFETAQGGTVFLDEIGDLPLAAQGTLLRVLQEGEVRRVGESLPRRVDVRVVAATHRDLERMVAEGAFRQDLFFRLRVGSVELPPLRERGEDVLLLAEHLLGRLEARTAAAPRLSAAARQRLLAYRWPGNVRELQNVLSVAAALAGSGPIEPEHLGLPLARSLPPPGAKYHERVNAYRRQLIADALDRFDGNRADMARDLGLSRQSLSYLIRRLGLL